MRVGIRTEGFLVAALLGLLPIERGLVLDVGGFTFRPVYPLFALLFLLALPRVRLRLSEVAFLWGLALWLFLSPFFSFQWEVSLAYGGWAFLTMAGAVALIALIRAKPTMLGFALRVYALSAAFFALVALVQWGLAFRYPELAYSFLGPFPRVQALTLEPSYLATYLVFPFFLSLARGWWGCATFIGGGLLVSTSRTGLVAVALGLGLHGLVLLFRRRLASARRVQSFALWGLLIVVLLFLTWPGGRLFWLELGSFLLHGLFLQDVTSAQPRLESWFQAWDVFKGQPWTGVGVGAYGYAASALGYGDAEGDPRTLKTTNLFLEVLAEMGIFGLALLLFWIALPLSILLKPPMTPEGYALALAFLATIFTFPFIQTWWRPYLWVPWALAMSYAGRTRS
ncbi:lipid A core-O-antigen ligase-like enyme [Thermus oshimai JL-2]|uniref:Lipid A core-O-antigen ligase-like enyme n=1 Tax=Thermus oshimai JL-2 TaxID=751945 RepID=K7QTZ5_THEOS|nr:lipid A core-O-antigen ligase-like enyme [Thermus oshimai JL-2]